jgi:hypothetical protein
MADDGRLRSHGGAWTRAFCPHCDAMKTVHLARNDPAQGFDLIDILCDDCDSVIATLDRPVNRQARKAPARRRA